jgi:lysophospholipase L1-like esterase
LRFLPIIALLAIIASISLFSTKKYNTVIIADGNSYVSGNGHIPFTDYLKPSAHVLNFGVGGQTTLQMLADQRKQVLPNFHPGKKNILIVIEGGNDIFFHGSVDSAYLHYKAYCLAAKAVGFKVIASTTIPRLQPSEFGDNIACFNEKMKEFNARLVSDPTFYSAKIRPDTCVAFRSFTSPGYDRDGIHPSDNGQKKLAELIKKEMGR